MINVRPIKPEDFLVLSEIYKEAYNSLKIGENWTQKSALALLEYMHKVQPDLFFVAEDENVVIGGITANVKPWWDGNHLVEGEIFVSPSYQGKGVGKKLVKMLFEEAQSKYNAVSWDTFTHIVYEHPLSWYKKLGFEEIKHWTMITGNIKKVLKSLT